MMSQAAVSTGAGSPSTDAGIAAIAPASRRSVGSQYSERLAKAPLVPRLQVASSSDVAVSLMYMHPGTNAELDFLFGPGGDRKRYKRRRGERGQPGKQLAAIGVQSAELMDM